MHLGLYLLEAENTDTFFRTSSDGHHSLHQSGSGCFVAERLFMDGESNKRVVWLLNHTTLREFEVPLLCSLGLEVYCPKRFPRNPDNRSASVSFEFDNSLSLPEPELAKLNEFDFYSEPFTPEIRQILNDRFGSIIVAYMFPMFEQVLANFRGRILLRTFGSTHPTYTYYSFAREVASPAFERLLARASQRFWFAQAYPNLKTIEPPIIQRRSVDLPLGLPERITRHKNTWTGGQAKILFVCPEIDTYQESKQIYNEFKTHFGKLWHVICGAQSKPHNDPAVLGKVDDQTYAEFFRTCNVMFYHSRLPRHIHYHPLEAICYGMPVVYMQQGMLGQLTDRKLPGACDTIGEAIAKIERLIDGQDLSLAQQIRDSQSEIYHLFTKEYALERWDKEFVQGILQRPVVASDRYGPVAILPLANHSSIHKTCRQLVELCGTRLGVRLGSLEKWSPQTQTNASMPFAWKPLSILQLKYVQRLGGHAQLCSEVVTVFPDDGVCDFMDCHAWIVVGDRCWAPIASAKPYIFYFTRPVPDVPLPSSMQRWTALSLQNAQAVLVDTQEDRDLLVKEYGVSQDWIFLVDKNFNGESLWRIIQNIP
ncbi:MAG: hypothetical protein ACK5FS_15755 [Planctomycetota bacterium]|jgi:hypothetical protein